MKTSILYTSLIILSMLTSCKNNKNAEEKTDMGKAEAAPTEIYVDTIILNPQTFHQQLICNGRLKAIAKSELSFSNGGTVVAVHVHNGDMVQKGEVIARQTVRAWCLKRNVLNVTWNVQEWNSLTNSSDWDMMVWMIMYLPM
ncbi:biotin/lipoyl-binding protein [Phocaeicola paurosaccharolyticus]|uniref:biotin/lipoyl-binding protein n=1 Tax=Phocaeicola paurosaccharolyticus TaxID=732242 RepID=UPI000685238B|nr:biotin/lipoyl-binding protein [Phocaeicola paurosaccharolyticus]